MHGCAIDVRACVAYITQDRAGVIEHYERSFVHTEHADAVREMAGECVFLQANTGLSEACGLLRRAFMLRVLPLMSTTHRVEAAVREAALAAAAANRGEGEQEGHRGWVKRGEGNRRAAASQRTYHDTGRSFRICQKEKGASAADQTLPTHRLSWILQVFHACAVAAGTRRVSAR